MHDGSAAFSSSNFVAKSGGDTLSWTLVNLQEIGASGAGVNPPTERLDRRLLADGCVLRVLGEQLSGDLLTWARSRFQPDARMGGSATR